MLRDALRVSHGEMPASIGTASMTGTLQVVGHLWQPEIMQEAPVALRAMVEGPTGRQTATQLLYDSHSRTAAALCRNVIPPERSAAWVEGLLSHVKPQHILFAASLPVGSFQYSMPHSLQWMPILHGRCLLNSDCHKAVECSLMLALSCSWGDAVPAG
jgi:hypothetical protein